MALSLALSSISYSTSNAQTSVTGNLITNTQQAWTGCSTATAGAFWGGVSGGPCPGIDASGHIIFSWGQYSLAQTIAINQALAVSGSGLQINGYNYSWSVKNSNINGSQPGGYDPVAYIDVNLYDKSGSLLVTDRYNYGYQLTNWTTFSGTRTYTTPYAVTGVGNIQLAVTGKDSGFWAGYYGAEFMNFSLSLNYSVDPCSTNKLSSPNCPGYGAAYLASLTKPTTTTTTGTSSVTVGDPTVTDVGGVEMTTTGKISVADGTSQTVKDSQTSSKTSTKKDTSAAVAIGLNTVKKNAVREQETVSQTLNSVEMNNSSQSQLVNNILTTNSTQESNGPGGFNGLNIGFTINSVTQSQSFRPDSNIVEQRGSSVNKNTPNNSLAGGVDINKIAQTPAGFEMYMAGMADKPFYPPREIYRGQRNVDNANATRYLNGKNDVLHQMMIEQQYNIGN